MVRIFWFAQLMMVAALLGAVAPAQALAESADQSATEDGNWGSGCSSNDRNAPLDCSVFQRLIDSKNGGLIAMVRIRIPGDTKSPVMLVQMPLGIYLPAQVELNVDGASIATVAFQTCDQNGCYAGMEVPSNLLNAMLKGQKLELKIQNQARQPASVPISLTGFAKAYTLIK